MKLWILLPGLMVGSAFANGYSVPQRPQEQTQQPTMQTVPSSMQAMQMPAAPAPVVTPVETRKIDPQYPFGHLTESMSYLAFAAIIKYQFPGHDSMDSLALATRAVAAFPIYAPLVRFPAAQ